MNKKLGETSVKGASLKPYCYDTVSVTTKDSSLNLNNIYVKPPPPKTALHTPSKRKDTTKTNTLFASNDPPAVVIIGASTGGPDALVELLTTVPKTISCPIVIVQHMPENFTPAFSKRLHNQCFIDVKQAEDGDYLTPGRALLAPGGKQLIVDSKNKSRVKIIESTPNAYYKPCIDTSMASLCSTYGNQTLAIILTGMGKDGYHGVQLLRQQGATVWTQTKESCVVYGMPMAIDAARLSTASLSLKKMTNELSFI